MQDQYSRTQMLLGAEAMTKLHNSRVAVFGVGGVGGYTVEALARCKTELGVRTILGVSNISFGLPCRPYLNTTFLTMAMYAGLDLAIMNPLQRGDDGGGVCLQRADQPRSAEHQVH